ncbi:hypothetical protein [Nonomuraea guangzhouensis]|uniref:Uncharacterized protein n=1 Tax=Nonomuraea guangzhouensis TaxID=1291555 RepID=A0ABW4G6V5_9ACTN|nr:hypothetical protein [Nonomuraea guangzhouensis]
MLRNLFLGAGTLLILVGVGMIVFDPPGLFYSSDGRGTTTSTPTSFALVALSEPVLLVVGGVGMMLGAIAAAGTCNGQAASGRGTRLRGDRQSEPVEP